MHSGNEIVQIVDRQNKETGVAPRHRMRSEGLTHRACYILVFNDNGELYLQKRTESKDVYPDCWDVAAGGVVLGGESYADSAKRELAEELGVSGVRFTFLFDSYFEDSANKVWGHIFSCTHNGPFVLQEEEVQYGHFMAVEKILALSEKEAFTPDGVAILRRVWKRMRETNVC